MKLDLRGLIAGMFLISIAVAHKIVVDFQTWFGVFGRYFVAIVGCWILIDSQIEANISQDTHEKRSTK